MAGCPNVVLVLADDMGYGDFGFLNGGESATPQLDDLASCSRVYSQHYSASPVCAPARAALLTGRYPQRTGVVDTLEARGTDRMALDETTLADRFRAAGYRTGLVGKWHTGAMGATYHPTARGFEEFVGFRGGWQSYDGWQLERGHAVERADGRYLTDVFGEEAVAFIRRHADEPFFLHVAFNAPHFPLQAPADDVERHRSEGRTEAVATIYAMIERMDTAVGRIRQCLADLRLDDRTLLVFTSDNGPDLGGEGEGSAMRYAAGLAGAKQHVLEGGIRLPLIAHGPGLVVPGQDDHFVHFTDWFPTLTRLAGVGEDSALPLDGVDVGPTLAGGTVETGPRCWQWTRYHPMRFSNAAVRDGRWKLVHSAAPGTLTLRAEDEKIDHEIKWHPERHPTPVDLPVVRHDEPAQRPMLFDLEADPGEEHDLAAQEPSRVAALEGLLGDWFEDVERDRSRIGATR